MFFHGGGLNPLSIALLVGPRRTPKCQGSYMHPERFLALPPSLSFLFLPPGDTSAHTDIANVTFQVMVFKFKRSCSATQVKVGGEAGRPVQ